MSSEIVSQFSPIQKLLDQPLLIGLRPQAFTPAEEVKEAFRIRVRVAASEALGHENIVYFESPVPVYGQDEERSAARERQPAGGTLGWSKPRKLGKPARVGLQHLLRVLVSNTGPLPTHAVT
ncbi:MAG: hypothetical protein ACQESR_18500, partial [Planctomycetota bacterium]